jgi:hypothetical protein
LDGKKKSTPIKILTQIDKIPTIPSQPELLRAQRTLKLLKYNKD